MQLHRKHCFFNSVAGAQPMDPCTLASLLTVSTWSSSPRVGGGAPSSFQCPFGFVHGMEMLGAHSSHC